MKTKSISLAFFDAKPYDMDFFGRANPSFGFKFKFFAERLGPDTVSMASGHDAVCVFVNDNVNAQVINHLRESGVRLVALRCAGYNNVDFKEAYGKLHVVRVPAYSPHAVAEHAVALMLALNRKTHRAFFRTRDGNFSLNGLLGFDMHGKTVGVIGAGKIGGVLIGILKGFGMRVLVFDPSIGKESIAALGCEAASLDAIYAGSDIISLHCPLTPGTRHIIDASAISKMKRGAMLINTSRGGLIDSKALVAGLKSKRIGSAGLDVYEEESEYFFQDKSDTGIDDDILARLLSFNNVLVTSHQGFLTTEALSNIASTTLENIRGFFAGDPLPNEICYKCGSPANCVKASGASGRCFDTKAK